MTGHPGTTDPNEIQGFCTDTASRAVDSMAFDAKGGQVLPERQMLNLLPLMIVSRCSLTTFTADITLLGPCQVEAVNAIRGHGGDLFHSGHVKALNSQERCKTILLHPMRTFRFNHRKLTTSDAYFFSPFSPTVPRPEPPNASCQKWQPVPLSFRLHQRKILLGLIVVQEAP